MIRPLVELAHHLICTASLDVQSPAWKIASQIMIKTFIFVLLLGVKADGLILSINEKAQLPGCARFEGAPRCTLTLCTHTTALSIHVKQSEAASKLTFPTTAYMYALVIKAHSHCIVSVISAFTLLRFYRFVSIVKSAELRIFQLGAIKATEVQPYFSKLGDAKHEWSTCQHCVIGFLSATGDLTLSGQKNANFFRYIVRLKFGINCFFWNFYQLITFLYSFEAEFDADSKFVFMFLLRRKKKKLWPKTQIRGITDFPTLSQKSNRIATLLFQTEGCKTRVLNVYILCDRLFERNRRFGTFRPKKPQFLKNRCRDEAIIWGVLK